MNIKHISLCGFSILSLLCLELHLFPQLYSVPPPASEEEFVRSLCRDLTNSPTPSWAAVPLHWVRQQSDKLALFSVAFWTSHTPLPGKIPSRFLESTSACNQVTLEQEIYFSLEMAIFPYKYAQNKAWDRQCKAYCDLKEGKYINSTSLLANILIILRY